MATQKRQFRLDNHAISMLIQAQAGSLQKAILEAVANALDAGASQVKVKLTPDKVLIEDDGRGFQNKEEIDKFFDTFGFDHSQLDRKVGRFGVGRGQLFHFGKNLWTTHGFTMAVDTREDMFGYDLGEAKKAHKGVKIAIELYEPMSFSQLSTVESELRKLVKFSTIPVILNGKAAQKSPQDVKWDAETDDAWFQLDDSYELKVYSQGLFVQGLPSRQFGKGGVVVTKLGKPLKQNMARNDMLITDCDVWKRVRGTLTKLSSSHQEKAKSGTTMTEPLRASMATKGLQGSGWDDFELLHDSALFTLTNGRHLRLSALLAAGFVASAPNKDPAADLLIQRKQASIINLQTLHRFGVDTVGELHGKLVAAVKRYIDKQPTTSYGQQQWERRRKIETLTKSLNACVFKEKVGDLPMQANISLIEVKDSEANADERLALSLIRRELLPSLTYMVWNALHPEEQSRHRWNMPDGSMRRVQLASSEAFLACTDGASKIWLERKFLRKCIANGATGYAALANTLVHELLHDVDTSVGHDHDHEFYQIYHDLTVNGEVAALGMGQYRRWLARGGKANAYNIKDMEGAGEFTGEAIQERIAALAEPAAVRAQVDQELGLDGATAEQAPASPGKPTRKRAPR